MSQATKLYPETRFCGSFMLHQMTRRGGTHICSAGVPGNARQRRRQIRKWKSAGLTVKQFVEHTIQGSPSYLATKVR